MKTNLKETIARAAVTLTLALVLTGTAVAGTADYGAAGAANTASSWSVEQMLRYAIEDEYFARAEYVAVMDKFGAQRPFTNIKKSEDQHIQWLTEVYADRKLAMPADDAASRVPIPASLTEAYKTGEKAEIDNIAMYAAFLRSPLLSNRENADVKALFERLMRASENHLKSFRTQLSR